MLAALLFVLALVRLGWSRRLVRRTSFLSGMVLAVVLAAVLVELEAWGPRFTSFATFCSLVLVVLPVVHERTRLFQPYPHLSALIPPPELAVMLLPLTAVNGPRWSLASSGFLYAFGLLVLGYYLLVAVRSGGELGYLAASLAALVGIFLAEGTAWAASGSSWKVFLIALGFALYAVDRLDRANRVAVARTK